MSCFFQGVHPRTSWPAGDESSIGSDLLFVPLPLLFQVDEERKTLVFEHEKTSPETLHSHCSRIIAFNNEARL